MSRFLPLCRGAVAPADRNGRSGSDEYRNRDTHESRIRNGTAPDHDEYHAGPNCQRGHDEQRPYPRRHGLLADTLAEHDAHSLVHLSLSDHRHSAGETSQDLSENRLDTRQSGGDAARPVASLS